MSVGQQFMSPMADLLRRDQELDALGVNGDVADLTDATDFIDRFVAIIETPGTVTQPTLEYLTVDSYLHGPAADWPIGARHMLYWLDRLLKANKSSNGGALEYDDRLSEMLGWGVAAPDNLTDADPLGLVTTLEAMSVTAPIKVVIVDADAADDADPDSTDGCVRIHRNSVLGAVDGDITTINLVNKTTAGLFNGSNYRYKFWKNLTDLNERNGGGLRFPNSTTVESIMLVRNSVADHIVNRENQIGVRIEKQTVAISGTPTGGTYTLTSSDFGTTGDIAWNASSADVQAALRLLPNLEEVTVTTTAGSVPDITHTIEFHGVTTVANPATLTSTSSLTGGTPVINHVATQTGGGQNTRITLRGYPGEWPEVWCGNSTNDDDDVTPGTTPDTFPSDTATNGTASMFRIGQTSTQYRNNFHIRNIHWHGKRETAGNKWIFCGQDILRFTYGSGCSARFCQFTDFNPIANNDTATNLAAAPTLIDHANSVRSVRDFMALHSSAPGFVCDSNYFRGAAIASYPNASNSSVATISTSDSNSGSLRFNTTGAHGLTSGDISVSGHTGFTGNTKLGKFTIASVTANSITTTAPWTGTGGTDGTIRVPPNDGLTGEACFDIYGDDTRVTRNQFRGVIGVAVRAGDASGLVIEDNIIEGYDASSVYIRNCTDVVIRRNRIGPHGSADYSNSNASHGIQVGYSSDVLIENNVFFAIEPTNNVASYGVWIKALEDDPEADPPEDYTTGDITIRSNLFYRDGIFFDNDSYAAADLLPVEISDNIVAGFAEANKLKQTTDDEVWLNAPIAVNFLSRTGNVAGTLNGLITITGNQLWRFANATPTQSTVEAGAMLLVRNTSADDLSDYYDVDDTLTGWTDNTVAKPDWTGNPEWIDINNTGDFRLTTDPIGFADAPFTEALSKAWEPD